MGWDELFDDLSAQLERGLEEEAELQRIEEERLRLSRLTLKDRIRALSSDAGSDVGFVLELEGEHPQTIRPNAFGRDWIAGELVSESGRVSEVILPLAGISALTLTRTQVRASLETPELGRAGELAERLGLAFILRDLARKRRTVHLWTALGSVTGTIDRVGKDHLDLAIHLASSPRREPSVHGYRIIPFEQLRLIRVMPA